MLAAFDPTAQTNIGSVLHDWPARSRRKGIIILISDLFDDEERILDGIQHLRFGGNEVIVFHVMDPFELEFPFTGMVEFDGLEVTGQDPHPAARDPQELPGGGREVPRAHPRRLRAEQRALRAGEHGAARCTK